MAWLTKRQLAKQEARFANMAKKRAEGGGRKPLTPTEPTVKVAITLLSSQVEAMKQLGDGNVSAGIRKVIDMNIRKPDNIHVEFKSLDWQNAVATMRPINAVRLLAKEVQSLVEQNCPGETPQHKGRQAELIHNAFVSGAYPHLTGTKYSLLYGAVANKMYHYHSAK